MDENRPNATPSVPAAIQVAPAPKSPKIYQVDRRDRVFLGLTFVLGILLADLFLAPYSILPGLGLTLLVLCWEGLLLGYTRGGSRGAALLQNRPSLWLTLAVMLLAADFALFSNHWLRLPNGLGLFVLLVVQMFEVAGGTRCPWYRPKMLTERGGLLCTGLFCRLPVSLQTLLGKREKRGGRRLLYVLLGLVLTLPLLMIVTPMLLRADPLFDELAGNALRLLYHSFGTLLGRLFWGLLVTPFLFGLLYTLRRPEKRRGEPPATAQPYRADPVLAVTVLTIFDGLYLCFVGVQSWALFGGKAYVEAMGITFADYARSGFFELVRVSVINLILVVAAVQFCRREGALWRAVQLLGTGTVALSGVMLISAVWRMTLYVLQYGLSFKRLLTYWGMGMLTIFFGAALLKIWKTEFGFFRVLMVAGIAGWLLLNAANPDAIVASYNVALYEAGNGAVMDLPYLASLSYDALPALARLTIDLPADYGQGDAAWEASLTASDLIAARRRDAAEEVNQWRTWSLSAYLAAWG